MRPTRMLHPWWPRTPEHHHTCGELDPKPPDLHIRYGESEKDRRAFDNADKEEQSELCERAPYLALMGKLVWPKTMVRLRDVLSEQTLQQGTRTDEV